MSAERPWPLSIAPRLPGHRGRAPAVELSAQSRALTALLGSPRDGR